MDECYKLVVSNSRSYREEELKNDGARQIVGTSVNCDVRIPPEEGREDVELTLCQAEGRWVLACPANAYFTTGGLLKQSRRELEPGDELSVRLQGSGAEVFRLTFLLDFEREAARFDRRIDIKDAVGLVIGDTPNANIRMSDELLRGDFITLTRRRDGVYLSGEEARYGAYLNGVRISGEQKLRERDFFSLAGYRFYWKDGALYTDGRTKLSFSGVEAQVVSARPGEMEYPRFVRNVRRKIVPSREEISVLDPPQKPQKPKTNIVLQLLPALGSVALIVLLRGVMGGGGSYIIFSACSMGLGAVTSVISFITGNKDYKKEVADREREYNEYIVRKREEIEAARSREAQQLTQIYRPAKEQLRLVRQFSSVLFDRQREDEDFLRLRIGEGEQPALREVKIAQKEAITVSDKLAQLPKQLAEEYRNVAGAPVWLDCANDGAIGVVGDGARLREMVKLMTLDLTTRQYYSDLRLVYLLPAEDAKTMAWLRWLPHVHNEQLDLRNIVCDEESKNVLFEYLYVELSAREQEKRDQPRYVVFVLDDYGLKSHPVSRYISRAAKLGFTFIFFEEHESLLPQGCREEVILERGGNEGSVLSTEDVSAVTRFTYTPVSDGEMERAAIKLSPVYSEEVSLENSLTKSIGFYELLGILSPGDIDLEGNWARAAVDRSLAAPLGVKAGGEMVYLDLHERAHGPHGLVAGTTGSGKSELLQSYILSMAICYHPYEVSFVIIDFKGGGMVNQFRQLPHLVGAITNIDGKEIDRSLKSIKAELQKRQRRFAEVDVNNINDYIRLYKRGRAPEPLPHLIIVVDEFAELKADQPGFMKELISAARIGRSLGVHLILATQKPSGQVNEQIWSNSRFKLCLKVQDQSDSNEVIHSPLAAEIKEPGRAYLQVGNNEIFELFQSAYSGGPEHVEGPNARAFTISQIHLTGRRTPVYVQKPPKSAATDRTQLDAMVDYIASHCRNIGLEKLPDICLPPLPETVEFQSLRDEQGLRVCVGVYDAPEQQYQGKAIYDLAKSNLLVIGSLQTGKTNLLQVIIRALASQYDPNEVNIYIIDFGTMVLKNFEPLAHVGGVVCPGDSEKLKNLFKMLSKEITKRKNKLMNAGVSSYSAYYEAGNRDMPLITLMVDNVGLLKELYLTEEDPLLPICREGLSVGISVILTNSQTTGIGYRYMANFDKKLAFYCTDNADYSVLFGRGRVQLENMPGRCLVEQDKELYEAQVYRAFEGEKEFQRVKGIQKFIIQTNSKVRQRASAIPMVPETLTAEYITENYDLKNNMWCLGLSYDSIEPVYVDCASAGTLGIVSLPDEEQNALISSFMAFAERNCSTVYLMDDMTGSLKAYSGDSQVKQYAKLEDSYGEALEDIYQNCKQRYNAILQGGEFEKRLLLVAVIGRLFIDTISADRSLLEKFKEITTKYKNMGVFFVFFGMENTRIPIMGGDVLRTIRDNNKFLVLVNLKDLKVLDPSISQKKLYPDDRRAYDAFFFADDSLRRVKLIQIAGQ